MMVKAFDIFGGNLRWGKNGKPAELIGSRHEWASFELQVDEKFSGGSGFSILPITRCRECRAKTLARL